MFAFELMHVSSVVSIQAWPHSSLCYGCLYGLQAHVSGATLFVLLESTVSLYAVLTITVPLSVSERTEQQL